MENKSDNLQSAENFQSAEKAESIEKVVPVEEVTPIEESDPTAEAELTTETEPAAETEPTAETEPAKITESTGNSLSSEDMAWLNDLLNNPKPVKEIGADEQAVESAGLTDPQDAELEKILAEDWSKIPDLEELEALEASETQEEALAPPELTVSSEPKKQIDPEISEATIVMDKVIPDDINEELFMESENYTDRKIRPKRKKGYGLLGIPHILATAVWLALIVAIGLSLGRMLWVCCADVMAFGKEPNKVTITITKDDTIDTIAQKLGQADLVRYPGLFKLFATITGKDKNISTGTFTLDSQLDYNAMINAMVYYGTTREVVDIMFPDGANCAQIFKLLEEKNVCTVAELEEYAANGELRDYWFLEGVPRGDKYCLEGYMSPDTYRFYTNDEPRRVIEKFLNEFNSRFTDIMKENFVTMQTLWASKLKANGFNAAYIEANPLTLHQVVTLASVVQRETASDNECYQIASVFYNRLSHPDHLLMGSDATVHYAIGDYFNEIKELTQEHLNVDSPYNTRKSKGFPPGPICNFGVHSLYAALEPNDTNYYYFVYDKKAYVHRFAETYQQHMQNVAQVGG